MLDDLLADTNSGHNIVATVFVQCRSMHRADGPEEFRPVGETEFVNGVAAMSARGGYGQTQNLRRHCRSRRTCALARASSAVLEAHIRAGGGRFRGIRHITAYDADPTLMNPGICAAAGLMATNAFREGFASLAPWNLTFDAWLYHPQIGDLTSLAQAFPGTGSCLNHVGGPLAIGGYAGKRDEIFADMVRRRSAIWQPARMSCVKLGGWRCGSTAGLPEKADPPSSEDACRRVETLFRDLHRRVRHRSLHVRKQFPGR